MSQGTTAFPFVHLHEWWVVKASPIIHHTETYSSGPEKAIHISLSHSQSNNGYKRRFMPPSKFFAKQSNNTLAHIIIQFYQGCLLV